MVRDSTILLAVFGSTLIAFAFMLDKAHEASLGVPDFREVHLLALWLLALSALGFLTGAFVVATTERRT